MCIRLDFVRKFQFKVFVVFASPSTRRVYTLAWELVMQRNVIH